NRAKSPVDRVNERLGIAQGLPCSHVPGRAAFRRDVDVGHVVGLSGLGAGGDVCPGGGIVSVAHVVGRIAELVLEHRVSACLGDVSFRVRFLLWAPMDHGQVTMSRGLRQELCVSTAVLRQSSLGSPYLSSRFPWSSTGL